MPSPNLIDLACVVHLHSTHSDGTGTVPEIVEAGRHNALDVVMLTDHDTLAGREHEGWHGDLLLLVGEEVSPFHKDHTLVFGVDEVLDHEGRAIADVVRDAPLAFAAHPFSTGSPRFRQFRGMPHSAPADPAIDGIELWSFVTDTAETATSIPEVLRFIARPESVLSHPRAGNMIEWDRICRSRRCVAIGGLDAHQIGKRIAGRVPLRLMSYRRSFRYLRTHVLCTEEPTGELEHDRAQVYDALREGRCYIALDAYAPARGFAFWADDDIPMGAEAPAGEHVLHVRLPRPAELRLLRDGELLSSGMASDLDHEVTRPGVYRVEARLSGRTWIVSNPVYFR